MDSFLGVFLAWGAVLIIAAILTYAIFPSIWTRIIGDRNTAEQWLADEVKRIKDFEKRSLKVPGAGSEPPVVEPAAPVAAPVANPPVKGA